MLPKETLNPRSWWEPDEPSNPICCKGLSSDWYHGNRSVVKARCPGEAWGVATHKSMQKIPWNGHYSESALLSKKAGQDNPLLRPLRAPTSMSYFQNRLGLGPKSSVRILGHVNREEGRQSSNKWDVKRQRLKRLNILTCDLRDRWLIRWLSSWGAAGPCENWVVKPRYPLLPGEEALAIRTNVRRKVTSDCSHKISRHSSSSDTSAFFLILALSRIEF